MQTLRKSVRFDTSYGEFKGGNFFETPHRVLPMTRLRRAVDALTAHAQTLLSCLKYTAFHRLWTLCCVNLSSVVHVSVQIRSNEIHLIYKSTLYEALSTFLAY